MNFLNTLADKCTHLINKEDLYQKLKSGKPLRVKLGADPSAPDLHLGHYVVLKNLKLMQDMGHEVIFLIGDFTGMIGDPTGKTKTRKPLSREQVIQNAETYKKQIFKVLDKDKTIIKFNSEWYLGMPFQKVLEITSKYTLARVLERNDFTNRFQQGSAITLTELLYPLVQGYDSVVLKADLEVGGSDQLFNLLVGRELQKEYQQEPQCVATFPLLEGIDGKNKMSKSLNNYIGLTDSPKDIFGKTMSLPDDLILKYFKLVIGLEDASLKAMEKKIQEGQNPRDLKMDLAHQLVTLFYDRETSNQAREEFLKIFSRKELPSNMPTITLKQKEIVILDLVNETALFKSKSQIRRLIKGGGVEINQKKIYNDSQVIELKGDMVLKVGKRNFYQIDIVGEKNA